MSKYRVKSGFHFVNGQMLRVGDCFETAAAGFLTSERANFFELIEQPASKGDAPKGDAPKGDEAKGDEAKGDAPKGDAPKGDEPKGDEPPKRGRKSKAA